LTKPLSAWPGAEEGADLKYIRALVVLMFASVLMSSPILADKVVLKNGQVYEGEIIEETDTYIHLKTDSEKLRIYKPDIDSILAEEKPPTESETEIEDWQYPPSDSVTVVLKTPPTAEADETSENVFSGRIAELTIERIILETKSGTRRIPLSRIASIERGNGRLLMLVDAVSQAERIAEAQVSKIAWFALGCGTSIVGVGAAYLQKPGPPPEQYLLGKPAEYAEAFTNAYEKKWKSAHRAPAVAGCISSGVVMAGCMWIAEEMRRNFVESEPVPDLSGWSCPGPY
jgi:hypothetical protein